MSDVLDEVELRRSLSLRPTCFKSIVVACATFHFYYTVTHLDEEVEYIWSKKWTGGKIMYLLTRYLGTIFLVCSVIGVNTYAWNDTGLADDAAVSILIGNNFVEGRIHLVQEPRTYRNFISTCFYGQLHTGFGPMVILAAEVILQMRVYAMYGRDKRLLAFLILLTIALFGFNILQMSTLFANVEANTCGIFGGCFNKRNVFRRAFIADVIFTRFLCIRANTMTGIAWSVTAFTEFLLFILVIAKARKEVFKTRKHTTAIDIRAGMARDSIAYFAVLITVCLIGALIVFVREHVLSEATVFLAFQLNSYETIAITIMTILAPKLIINIRSEFYGPSDDGKTQLSWNADVSESFLSSGGVSTSNDVYAGSYEDESSRGK